MSATSIEQICAVSALLMQLSSTKFFKRPYKRTLGFHALKPAAVEQQHALPAHDVETLEIVCNARFVRREYVKQQIEAQLTYGAIC